MIGVTVRPLKSGDVPATAQVFYDAVRIGTKDHYSLEQRKGWVPQVPEIGPWGEKLETQTGFVAEQSGRVVGFMTLTDDCWLDLAFLDPSFMGQGVGLMLYAAIEGHARQVGMPTLYAEASYLARPFFERQDWTLVKEQTVHPRGVAMVNFVMEKKLNS